MVKKSLVNDIQSLTNLDNPNSVQQMKNWLSENGFETESLSKSSVSEMLKTAPYQVHKVLSLRQQLAKSSVKKYTAMKMPFVKTAVQEECFSFTVQTELADLPEDWCSSRTCLRTICQILHRQEVL